MSRAAMGNQPHYHLVSVILNDDGGSGHNIPYAQATGEAARLNNWSHVGLVPDTAPVRHIPEHWHRELCSWGAADIRKQTRWIALWNLERTLRISLKRIMDASPVPVFLFVDSFSVLKLAALLVALIRIPRREVCVGLIYRYDFESSIGEFFCYRWLNRMFRMALPDGQFRLMTDSLLLQAHLRQVFRMPLSVLPIPHVTTGPSVEFDKVPRMRYCWWPGRPLVSKGLRCMEELCRATSPSARNYVLVAAQESGLRQQPNGPQVTLIEDCLTRTDYRRWFETADFILLPYDPKSYLRRTSGIFVEAVIAGKMPLVKGGSWAAQELYRAQLSELIVEDWSANALFPYLDRLAGDHDLMRRFSGFRQQYSSTHSIDGFAAALRECFASSESTAGPEDLQASSHEY